MSMEGDNQYPVVGQSMGPGASVTTRAPDPTPSRPVAALQHAQTEVDRAQIGLIQMDGLEFGLKLINAQITPSDQLRHEHLLNAVLCLERATGRLKGLMERIESRIREAYKK